MRFMAFTSHCCRNNLFIAFNWAALISNRCTVLMQSPSPHRGKWGMESISDVLFNEGDHKN